MVDVVLHPGRDRSVRRRHPWILSGGVASCEAEGGAEVSPGCEVRVLSAEGEILGFGHWSPRSALRVRMVAFGKEPPGEGWLAERIAAAVARRADHPLLRDCDAVRLVNAEADGLPGLVVDRYGDVAVVKLTAAGMACRRDEIAGAVRAATGAAAGYERADSSAARREGLAARQGPLWGELPPQPLEIRERGRRYRVDVVGGQKTGFYLDQRESRDLVETLAGGRRVVDVFAYTGGFAAAAVVGGARSVTLVESSAPALDRARENVAAAGACEAHFVATDAFRWLRGPVPAFDLAVLDPPPLARQKRDAPKAARAYKDLLLHTLRAAAPDAYVLAFACSHHVGPDLFRKVAFGASLDAGRTARCLRTLSAAADHPVSLDHPEGAYLTGLLLQV